VLFIVSNGRTIGTSWSAVSAGDVCCLQDSGVLAAREQLPDELEKRAVNM